MSKINSIGVGSTANNALSSNQINKSVDQANGFEKALEKAQKDNNDESLKKVCKDFESVFVNMMMKTMRQASAIEGDEIVEKSQGREIFEGMLDDELSKKVATGGGIGIANLMYKQLKKYTDSPADQAEKPPVIDEKK